LEARVIPATTREALLQAMGRFDHELRDQPEWLRWPEELGSHRWAISENGKLYPVKQVIAMATGQPTNAFSGGDEANTFIRKYGFAIVPLSSDGEPELDPLAKYAARFANLHSQVGAEWWPEATLHRDPHKPLLLLSVLDLISSGHIQSNEIDLDSMLRDRFRTYWSIVMPAEKRPNPAIPFRHLAGDGFWHLNHETSQGAGQEAPEPDKPTLSAVDTDEPTGSAAAHLDPELFELLLSGQARQSLSDVLLDTYFTPEARDGLRKVPIAGHVSYWWVNQGSTYKYERAGAYLWAPRTGKSNVAFGHWTNVFKVHPGDVVLHYANSEILAVSRVVKPPVVAPRPSELPADTWETDGYYAKVSPYAELTPPVKRIDIPQEWRTEEVGGPFTQEGNVKQGYLYPISAAFVAKLASRFSQIRELVDPLVATYSIWLFQANPDFYNLADALKGMHVGERADWSVSRYKDRIQPGDQLVLWQGGTEAGIYATGEITGRPFQRTDVGEWKIKRDGADATPDMGVSYQLTRILHPYIPKAKLQQDPILKNLMILRAPTGTNFAVTEQEWNAIQDLKEDWEIDCCGPYRIATDWCDTQV
jgi:EVE domain-containing protein